MIFSCVPSLMTVLQRVPTRFTSCPRCRWQASFLFAPLGHPPSCPCSASPLCSRAVASCTTCHAARSSITRCSNATKRWHASSSRYDHRPNERARSNTNTHTCTHSHTLTRAYTHTRRSSICKTSCSTSRTEVMGCPSYVTQASRPVSLSLPASFDVLYPGSKALPPNKAKQCMRGIVSM